MADATVEITGDDAGENAAETTQVEAVAQTAKDAGTAQEASTQAQIAASDTGMHASQAVNASEQSAQAALEAQRAAAVTQMTGAEITGAISSLTERIDSLAAALQTSTPAPTAPEIGTPVVEVQESSPAKGHWLTRKVGRKS
jgi:hypothetical protein